MVVISRESDAFGVLSAFVSLETVCISGWLHRGSWS